MDTCKNCKWWEKAIEYGKCNADQINDLYVERNLGAVDGMFNDCDEHECLFEPYTGPDFGCIHWKEKE